MMRTSLSDGDDGVAVFGSFAVAVVALKMFDIDANHRMISFHDLATSHVHSFAKDIAVADGDYSSDLELTAVAVEHVTDFDF